MPCSGIGGGTTQVVAPIVSSAKEWAFDRSVSVFESANPDNISAQNNWEFMAFVEDELFTEEAVERLFDGSIRGGEGRSTIGRLSPHDLPF